LDRDRYLSNLKRWHWGREEKGGGVSGGKGVEAMGF
jgi:hypothetical protein